MKRFVANIIILSILGVSLFAAEPPITGGDFDRWIEKQNLALQDTLSVLLPESEGFAVTGPLDPFAGVPEGNAVVYENVRVVASDVYTLVRAEATIKREFSSARLVKHHKPLCDEAAFDLVVGNRAYTVILTTIQQTRFHIWLNEAVKDGYLDEPSAARNSYSVTVCSYLAAVDSGFVTVEPPAVDSFEIDPEFDFYAEPPDYVIQGYQNYKDFLYSHAEIETDFAHGIYAFVPTGETLRSMLDGALPEAYPNKEAAMLQHELREFFERGGEMASINTLTAKGFDTLSTGEYFFCVGLSGKIRFGRELPREQVKEIEERTGRKIPRANHAFLFPGEPVLSAGAFFIDEDYETRLVKANAQSGHYFYSNINESIREDISERSDRYFKSLGHFLRALDSLGISYDDVLLSKLQ